METLRKFIAMVFLIYTIGVTGLCFWLVLSTSSSGTKLKEVQLELEQERGRYKLMEKKLQDDNMRIAEQISGSQKDRDTAKIEYQNALSRAERIVTESDSIKKDLESAKIELNRVKNEKSILEVEKQAGVEPLVRQAINEARVSFEKDKLKLNRELADVRDLYQKVQLERDNMTSEFQRIKSENNSLTNEKSSLDKKVAVYDKQLRSETQDKNKLNDELAGLREANAAYSKDNANLVSANSKLQQQVKDTGKEIASIKVLLADAKEQAAKLSKEKDSIDVQFNVEKSEKSKYYDESKKLRELSDKLTKELSSEKETARKLSEELNGEKAEKAEKVSELTKNSEELKAKNKVLSEDLRKATAEKEDISIKWKSSADKLILLDKDINRLEDSKKLLEAKYEARDKEYQKLETESQKTKRDLSKLEQEYTVISETLNMAKLSESRIREQLVNSQNISRETESRLRTETGKNENQIAALSSQNAVLQDSLTKAKSDLQSLTNNLKSEQTEKYKYYEECKLQTAKNTELQRQFENANLKIQSIEAEKNLSAERLKDTQSQADIIRKENIGLKTQSISLDTQIAQLKTQLDIASKQLTERESTLNYRITDLAKSLKDVTDEKEKISGEKAKAEDAQARLEKEYRAVSETVKAYDAELVQIRQGNIDFQNKLAKSEGVRSKVEKEASDLSDALKTSHDSERKSQEQLVSLQKTYRETELRLKEQMAKSEEQIIALNNTAKKLSAERESQDKQLNDLNEQLGLLTKENKIQKEQLTKVERDVKTKVSELASLQNILSEEKSRAQNDKAKFEEMQAKNSEQLDILGKDNKSQKEQLVKLEKDIKAKTNELVFLQSGLNEEKSRAQNDKAKYEEGQAGYEKQIGALRSDVSSLTEANKKLNKDVDAQGKQLRDRDEQIMTFSKDNKDYKERNSSLDKQLSKVENESRTKITELNDKLRSVTSERDDTLSRLRFTMDKVSSLEKDIKRYDDTNKSLEAKYEGRDKDFRSAEIERQKVTVDLKNANDSIVLLQKDKDDLTTSLKNAESQTVKTKESFVKKEEELRALQKTLKDMETQNLTAVNSLQSQMTILKGQADDLSKSLSLAVEERERVKEERNKNEIGLASVTKDNNVLKEKNNQLLKDFSSLQSKIKTQEYELNETLKKERESYQLALNDLNTTKETLRSAQWQVSELQTKNATLDKSVASLQNQLKNQETDMQATIKLERDMKTNYLSRAEDAEAKVNNYMKIEMELRQKNSTLEKEMAGLKVTMDDKIAEAMKQKETDYINRLREANERVKMMEETLTKERANFYYNLASYATKSQLFDDALDYYTKALALNPKDAATYYNMGVLYDEHLDNPSKAIFSYTKYLELAPSDASDREKVRKWIDNLQKRLKGSKDGFQK